MTVAQANSAKRQIDRVGRRVTFQRVVQTPDATRPWIVVSEIEELTATAVFVPPTGSGLGYRITNPDLIERVQQIAIVSLGGAATERLTSFDKIEDSDGSLWHIEFVQELRPASVSILYYVGVRR